MPIMTCSFCSTTTRSIGNMLLCAFQGPSTPGQRGSSEWEGMGVGHGALVLYVCVLSGVTQQLLSFLRKLEKQRELFFIRSLG